MSLPQGMFDELGQVAARFNERAGQHNHGCCTICRKALVAVIQVLLDPDNWKPESPHDSIQRLTAQIDALRAQVSRPAAHATPLAEPLEEDEGEPEPSPSRFPPQFPTDEE